MCKIADWLILAGLTVCGIHDLRKKEIPVLWIGIVGILVTVTVLFFDRTLLISRVVGTLIGLFFLFISKCTREAIGYGDSWLILILGVYLGSLRLVELLFWATMVAGVMALCLLWCKKWKRDISIPFVPYMVLAYLGVVII